MEDYTNKIYARKREDDVVVKFFSSVFENNIDTDFLVEEGNEDYHTHVHLKYQLMDEKGRYNYKITEDGLVELTEEEKEKLFPTTAPQMTEQEILNAQLLKQIAELKGVK